MKKLIQQFLRFSVVGVLAFAIDYALLAFFTEVVGINYLISATLSYALSTIFNYLASMRYVFRHKEGMSYYLEFIIFVVLSLIGLGLNNVCMWFGVEVCHGHYLLVKIIASAVVSLWNFFSRRKFLHAGDKPTPADDAQDGSDDDKNDSGPLGFIGRLMGNNK